MESAWEAVKELLSGLATVFVHLFRKPITEQYPEYKRPLPIRARGRIILTRDPDGEERCVACYLCSAVCPVNCISMEGAERPDGRRYAAWFRINFARCILCGFCEEACPTSAIQLTTDYEFSKTDILSFVYEKEDLLVDHQGKDKEYNLLQICRRCHKIRRQGRTRRRAKARRYKDQYAVTRDQQLIAVERLMEQ